MISPEIQTKAYYNSKSIIKWYQVNYEKKEEPADSSFDDTSVNDASPNCESGNMPDDMVNDSTAGTGDSALDDEVARIMANFANAHQDSVDSLFK